MEWLHLITDPYERKARLYPALLTIAPLAASGFAVLPDDFTEVGSLGLVALSSGGAYLLAHLGRDLGKECEKKLYKLCGGMPSMVIFRHRDEKIDPITKTRYHNKLAEALNTKAPTVQDEHNDRSAADAIYTAYSNYLRSNTRDKKFALLLKENTSYGYRRNVLGLRWVGIAASAISIINCLFRFHFVYRDTGNLDVLAGIADLFSLILLLFWTFLVTEDWVRIPADSYAGRLAESIEVLHPIKP